MASLFSANVEDMENAEFVQLLSQYVPAVGEDWDVVSLAVDAAMDAVTTTERSTHQQADQSLLNEDKSTHKNAVGTEFDDHDDDDNDDDDEANANADDEDAGDPVAVKRLRHREAMRRCRLRKRSRMGALEAEQEQLKALLRARLITHQHEEQLAAMRSSPAAPLDAESFGLLPLDAVGELRKLFTRAVSLKEALLDERKELEKSLRDHQKFERLVMLSTNQVVNEPKEPSVFHQAIQSGLAESDSMEDEASSSGQDSSAAGSTASSTQRAPPMGHWVEYLENEDPLFYEPESAEAVSEHIRECYLRVQGLRDNFDKKQYGNAMRETVCLGWTADHGQSRVDDNKFELRFRFRRRVSMHHKSLYDLQKATWNLMKDPVLNARLYSSLVVCKVVQYIGDNTFIFIRNTPDKDKRLHIRYFSMHSQMEYRTEQGELSYVTLMKVLEKDPHILESTQGKKPSTPVIWLKHGTLYLNFTEKADTEEIEIEYGGSVHCMSDEQAQYLLIEVGGMLMRWEQMVIPQRLLNF